MLYFENEFDKEKIKEIFVKKPLSYLNGLKLEKIFGLIKHYNCQNIIEIGTFAGGTSYLLQQKFPERSVTTIDTNMFEAYFTYRDHYKILNSVKESYPTVNIENDSILKIQKIYKEIEPKINFLQGNFLKLDIKNYDFFIVDDDHNTNHLFNNLEYIYNNSKGIVVVDDCVYPGIKNACVKFCWKYKIEKTNIDSIAA